MFMETTVHFIHEMGVRYGIITSCKGDGTKTSFGTLQFLSFDWFRGNGI